MARLPIGEGGPLAEYLVALRAAASGMGGVANVFHALNAGLAGPAEEPGDQLYHTDVDFGLSKEPTIRVVFNANQGDGGVGIIFRCVVTGAKVAVATPPGCGLAIDREASRCDACRTWSLPSQ